MATGADISGGALIAARAAVVEVAVHLDTGVVTAAGQDAAALTVSDARHPEEKAGTEAGIFSKRIVAETFTAIEIELARFEQIFASTHAVHARADAAVFVAATWLAVKPAAARTILANVGAAIGRGQTPREKSRA
jgi:hypothetical protein